MNKRIIKKIKDGIRGVGRGYYNTTSARHREIVLMLIHQQLDRTSGLERKGGNSVCRKITKRNKYDG